MTERSPNTTHPLVPIAILLTITLCCLLPFCNKAFNIDEPLFIWVAKQIQVHPLDFYGFKINWYGTEMGAASIIKNPPLAAYYLALVAALAGWNEIPLHLAFLLPALAAALGSYFLAREFSNNPLLATLMAVLNPVFILSSTTVMCDTTMLAFYVWAVYLWVRGTKGDNFGLLALAALLTALCALTKYFGVSLIPLLLLYSLACGRGKSKGALFLLIPVAILSLYQWETTLLYGRGLLSDAASYASKEKGMSLGGLLAGLATGLSFTGGCFLSALCFAGKLRDKRSLGAAALLVPGCGLALCLISFPHVALNASWDYYLQLALFMAAGLALLLLTGLDLWRHRDPDALLLALWVLGTFLFAALVNWSVNGRSILPMAPAAALIVARFLESKNGSSWRPGLRELALPLCGAFLLSMTVARGDYNLAGTARAAAGAVAGNSPAAARPTWFQGHWGFQYYMEQTGALPYDRKRSLIQAADHMVFPENNTNSFQEIYDQGTPLKDLEFNPAGFVSTMNFGAGAGYYSSGFGPLPFLVGSGFQERYHIMEFRRPVKPT